MIDRLKNCSGVALCFGLAWIAWFLGKKVSFVGGAVFGIMLGILVALWQRPAYLEKGIKFCSKKVLQYSIILLGFEMNMGNVLKVGGQSLFVMLFTLSAAFLMAFFMGKVLKTPADLSVLIGVGTSICGGSAIAATAPVIKAKDDEVAQAISTIFLFNIIAVFLFPFLGQLLGLSDNGFGMWAGTAVNDTSSVIATGSAWSERTGNDIALHFATIVKLTRTLMIIPITLALSIYTARKAKRQNSDFSFVKVFPWFVLGFLAAALIHSFIPMPAWIPAGLDAIGKFLIIMAMVGIGLNTNLKKLLAGGLKPLLLGLCCWFAVAAVSLLVQTGTGAM